VAAALRGTQSRQALGEETRREQERLRREHAAKQSRQRLLGLDEARRRRPRFDWDSYHPPRPSFTGVRVEAAVPLGEIVPYIDWSPFFAAWELRGTYPRIFENEVWGAKARELFEDAQALLQRVVEQRLLEARAAWGFFPAASRGDDIQLYADESREQALAVVHTLRQQTERPAGQPHHALADLVAPRESGRADYLGLFAATAGIGLPSLLDRFEAERDDYGAILAKALADRLAEALAEWLHRRARQEWGYGRQEQLSVEELIRERYRGIRPAPGYPACPDHSEKRRLFDLLDAERAAGMRLTESFAMLPASSICGYYFSHPQARYFTVGRIGHDQLLDYQRRKGTPLEELTRWLAPILSEDLEQP
jgi:5-methyltetrahydrofolate--homocysteine methyltransferase